MQRFSQKPRRHCREPMMPRSQVDRESRGRVMRVAPRRSHPGGVAGPREERGARLRLCSGLSQGMLQIRSAQAGGHPDQPSGLTVPALPVTGQGGRAPGRVGWPGSTHSPIPRGARSVFSRERARPPCARLPARGGIRPAEGHRPGSWRSWPVVALWASLWWPVGESPGPRVRTDVVGRAYRRQGVCSAGLLRGSVSVRLAPTLQSTPPAVCCVRHTCRLEGGASAGARVGPTSFCCWGGGAAVRLAPPSGPSRPRC